VLKLSGNGGGLPKWPVVVCLSFCWGYITQGCHQPLLVEPGHPFQGGPLHGIGGFPGTTPMDDFGVVQPVDGFG